MILSYSKENCEKYNFPEKILNHIKKHTIREDKNKRWKVGMTIQHYAMNPRNGGKQFATGRCFYLSDVFIDPFNDNVIITRTLKPHCGEVIKLNGIESLNQFAINDGFESWAQMKSYFDSPFIGRIIYFNETEAV